MFALRKTEIPSMGFSIPTFICLLFFCQSIAASELPEDFTDLSLEDLMNIEVTSVSKRPQKQQAAPAAVFVISNADIQRWGVTNIPDALRMVPGLHVARIDANKWAITARGFNSRFANKLLVLLDGRSVYTPLFAGVYWDALDTPLEDIDRIEIIRGPGGSLWGANAVNGVINIITKSAEQTQGELVTAGIGTDTTQLLARHGGKLDNGPAYRLYAKYKQEDAGHVTGEAQDDANSKAIGFRTDWDINTRDRLTIQGDYFQGKSGQQLTIATDPAPSTRTYHDDTNQDNGNILLHWERSIDENTDFSLQAYYDHINRDGPVLRENRDTFDLDFNYHLNTRTGHNLLLGAGYRRIMDNTSGSATFTLQPDDREVDLYTAFIQDEIGFLEDKLSLTLGSKFEHNDFTGFEYQPNIRIAWVVDDNKATWAAISRAVRTPSRGEHDVRLRLLPPDPAPPAPVYALGNDNFESEELLAYEIGFRYQNDKRWSSDLALFINKYDNLRTLDPTIFPPPEIGFPFDNKMKGTAWGVEWTGKLQISSNWKVQTSYTLLNVELELTIGSTDAQSQSSEDTSPQHQLTLWSAYNINDALHVDTTLRYVDDIKSPKPEINDYLELDLNFTWQINQDIELLLSGRNLLDSNHKEFNPDFIQTQPTESERSLYTQIKWLY